MLALAQHSFAGLRPAHHRAFAGHGARLYYLTKAKKNARGEGRVFANYEEVLMALEAKEVETLSPIRLRYTGQVLDLTTAYDDQDLTHIEPVDYNSSTSPRRWAA